MSYISRIEKSIEYIEANIETPLSLGDIADASGFSKFHFCRIFKALTDNTVEYYIRRRRLTLAAEKLITTNRPIIDVALDYGYNSQEAFTRAFKEMYCTTPMAYRSNGFHYVNSSKIVLSPEVLERSNPAFFERSLTPRMVVLKEFDVVGFGINELKRGTKANMWNKFDFNEHRIKNRKNKDICYGLHLLRGKAEFWYVACCEVGKPENIAEDMIFEHIPANKYAVFEIPSVPEYLHKTITNIYKKWLPDCCLEPIGDYAFECFNDEYIHNDPRGACYFYIPVK